MEKLIPPDTEILTGQTERHLCSPKYARRLGARVHHQVVPPFLRLREEAARAGFDLHILSGFRNLDVQASIWNRKVRGELAILDSQGGVALDIEQMHDRDIVFAILRWSALPGASRHHWGTDIDVYDENARPEGYEINLIPEEVEDSGIFAPLHEWIDERICTDTSHGFFRPYDEDRQGVAPERWHLSHSPIATTCENALSVDIIRVALSAYDLELKATILEHLDDIYQRFVINTNPGSM